jgi:hypothetical protein
MTGLAGEPLWAENKNTFYYVSDTGPIGLAGTASRAAGHR